MVAINLVMVLALLLVGLLAHSLGVLASGADYLGDAREKFVWSWFLDLVNAKFDSG